MAENVYKAIYRKYRPEVFEDVLGQDHIVRVLRNQIDSGEVSHAYLFCGTRGTGKTTVARLLAKAVNCSSEGRKPCGVCENCRAIQAGTFLDLKEMDAASNRGIEDVRELRDEVNYPPVVGKKKVYILDEAHMLTKEANNALLKTLEEPPEDVIFVLCTTAPEEIPPTVLSRCVRMDFRTVGEKELFERMRYICGEYGAEMDDDAIKVIVALADGSARDGLSLLEQCIAGRSGHISREDVLDSIGAVGEDTYMALTDAVKYNDPAKGFMIIEDLIEKGRDTRQIIQGWLSHFRNLLIIKCVNEPQAVLSMSMENMERVRAQSDMLEMGEITGAIREISRTLYEAKRSAQPRVLLEMAMVKLASGDAFDEEFRGMKAPAGYVPQAPALAKAPEPQSKQPAPAEKEEVTAEETAAEPKVPADDPAAAQAGDIDIEAVWNAFLERGENEIGGQFTFIRDHGKPLAVDGDFFDVQVGSGFTIDFMENHKERLNAILSDIIGERKVFRIAGESGETKEKKQDLEDTLAAANSFFGIDIDVE